MFVTITALLEGPNVVGEYVSTATLTPVPVPVYLANRRDSARRFCYTPTRVVIAQSGKPFLHVVEYTGVHYGVMTPSPINPATWRTTNASVLDMISPHDATSPPWMYTQVWSGSTKPRRPMKEEELVLKNSILMLAHGYFHDCFHLTDTGEE